MHSASQREEIESVHRRLEAWRRRPGRGRAIPQELWRAAAELLERHPPSRVAERLRLNLTKLRGVYEARRAGSHVGLVARRTPLAFVELPPPDGPRPCGERGWRIVVEGGGGARLSIDGSLVDPEIVRILCQEVLAAADARVMARA